MVILQGDVYWTAMRLGSESDTRWVEPHSGGAHSAPARERSGAKGPRERPSHRSAIATTVVVAITSNLRLAAMPGNVRLGRGEAGLPPQPSVVNVSQIRTVDRTVLRSRVGMLRRAKVNQVLAGLALLLGTDEITGSL